MSEAFKRLFPRAYFSRLQENNVRVDGRTNTESRKVTVVPNVISTADASALCTIGRTSVICGVRYEVGIPLAAKPEEGRIQVTVEIGGICSPNPSEVLPILLEQTLMRLVDSGLVNGKDLCIQPIKAAWVLKCHIICLDDDGSVKDACILSFVEALRSLRLPSDVIIADNDGQVRIISPKNEKRLNLNYFIVPLSAGVFDDGAGIIIDPCAEEESVVDCIITVVVDVSSGDCLSLQKSGGSPVSLEHLQQCLDSCKTRVIKGS